MQKNPLLKIGENIRQDYESWLVADVVEGMDAFFSLATDVQRLSGDFLPGWGMSGRTQILLESFTAGFVPMDLLPKNNASKQGGEMEPGDETRPKRPTFFEDSSVGRTAGNAEYFTTKNVGETADDSYFKSSQTIEKEPYDSIFPSVQHPKTDWLVLPVKAADKLTEYLAFLNENEQVQPPFFPKKPTEIIENGHTVFSPKTEKVPLSHFEEKPKTEQANQADAALPTMPFQAPFLSANPNQPLKNLKDFAQLFTPQESGSTEVNSPIFHTKNKDEYSHSPLPKQAADDNISSYLESQSPNDFSQNNPLNHIASNHAENAAQSPIATYNAQAPSPDMDDIMDELSQRLTKEYHRFYG